MNIRSVIAGSALSLMLSFPLAASAECDLGAPVIELMPHLKELRAELNLNEEQNQTLDNWIAEAPAKRKQLAQETCMVREKLRDALLSRDTRLNREELKADLADKQTRLVEMRSLCARMLHDTLTPEQYDKVVERYRASLK